jgi:ubiquitin carboxyl-terminal hydrolase 4/11
MILTGEGYVIQPTPPEPVKCATKDSDSDEEEFSSANSSPSKHASRPLVLKRHVPEGVITLEECLQMFTSEETLDEDNSWYCSNCKTHRQALMTMQFWSLPKILIIGLKRFETSAGGGMMAQMYGARHGSLGGGAGGHREKISTFVDFPIRGLDLSPFCKKGRQRKKGKRSRAGDRARSAQGSSSQEEEEVDPDDPFIYDLYAVCNHYGRMEFGHYTAMARDWEGLPPSDGDETTESSNLWCSYDDDIVHVIDEKSVKTSAAYILFYRQRILCKK